MASRKATPKNKGGAGTLETTKRFTADPNTGRIDKDHHLAFITDTELKALNYLKDQDRARGYSSGSGPELKDLASRDTGESLQYVEVDGKRVPSLNDAGWNDSSDEDSVMGDDSTDPNSGTQESHYYTESEQEWVKKAIEDSWRTGDDRQGTGYSRPQDRSETKEYSGDKPTLKGLYDAVSGGQSAIDSYLAGFAESTSSYTNETGGTTTVTTKGLDHGISSTIKMSDLIKDSKGNFIGWRKEDGSASLKDNPEFAVDSDGNWHFVGKDSVSGYGGDGNFQAIDKDGNTKEIGARTFEEALGFDQEALDKAVKDRADRITEMEQRQEYYGGTYDPSTGRFTGGKEQEAYAEAETYEQAVKDSLKSAKKGFDENVSKAKQVYGEELQKSREIASEQEALLRDDFYDTRQEELGKVQRDIKGYRGRVSELADRGTDTYAGARTSGLYASAVEEVDSSAEAEKNRLKAMFSERGISINSPMAIKMLKDVNDQARSDKLRAKRDALMNQVAMADEQARSRIGYYGEAANIAGKEIGAIESRVAVRGDRLSRLSEAAKSRLEAGQSAGAFYGEIGSGVGRFYQGQASAQADRSDKMFSRGSYFGTKAVDLNAARLADALDRQYGQEDKQAAAMQMRISKYGTDKEADLAEKLAQLQAKYSGATGSDKSGGRSGLFTLLGGVAGGYFGSSAGPAGAASGASAGMGIGAAADSFFNWG